MQTVFEEIKHRLPITELLASYITLIPSGTQFKAKCPFHTERSASFSVSPDRGLYYCFGCGAKGDIFTFVEQFEGLDKKGALRVLAEKAGVVLEHTFTERQSSDPLYDMLEKVTTRYQLELGRRPEIREYLGARGITPETIEKFRIGYAPDEWRWVATSMKDEAESAIGERAGLIKNTPKGYYDRFRKRVMFPLMDASGRVVGFSGRLYPVDQETDGQSPKYLNSPETELFQKSRILFGFDKAKQSIRQHNFAILVEGQMDVVLSHQAGFTNTVASSGTAVSDASAIDPTTNLSVLARLTPNLFLAFDGDAAGQKALDRAAIVALGLGMNPKVVALPQGVDPADFIHAHGKDAWKDLLKGARHFLLHQLYQIDTASLSPHMLATALKSRIFPYLSKVRSPLEQSKYIETIASHIKSTPDAISRELALYKGGVNTEKTIVPVESPQEDISLLDRFVALVARFPTDNNKAQYDTLSRVSFEGEHIELPSYSDPQPEELLHIIERDYGTLPEGERELLVREIAQKLQVQFYTQLRSRFSDELAELEQMGQEEAAQALMTKLHTLNLSLQKGG